MAKPAPPTNHAPKPVKELPTLRSSAWVAEKLGVSIASVQRLALSGQIASMKVGGKVKFADHDVWTYLQQQRKISEQLAAKRLAASSNTVPAPAPDDRQLPLDAAEST